MCSCHADDQAGFPPSVIREHTCILRNCMGACVRVCVCVYTCTYLYVSLVWWNRWLDGIDSWVEHNAGACV